jgi:hypothetical protein
MQRLGDRGLPVGGQVQHADELRIDPWTKQVESHRRDRWQLVAIAQFSQRRIRSRLRGEEKHSEAQAHH